ncbi:MAG: ABC transporter ATP-binding protein [Holosporaceae bacterium]|jgi:ABC-2 type transport system ATP-binding protein|nr:ABC transporter ATP-binding protein [Holosporaceae bacterium]
MKTVDSIPIVNVENLYVAFGDFYAVNNVSFSVYRGEIFGFLGVNGAGKTTTIRVLCGLLNATSGKVWIDGAEFLPGKENIIKSKVGYMSQKFTLYDDLSINENLEFAASLREIPQDIYEAQKKKLLDFIGFNKDVHQLAGNLSGGIKQEIALVAAILHNPSIIFLDEPTAGVAPVSRQKFWNLIRQLSRGGKTIFVTTHYMDEAENCERVALMRSGEIVAMDTPQNLKNTTYHRKIYLLTIKNKEALDFLRANARKLFSMFSPYGARYHVILADEKKEKSTLQNLKEYCDAVPISPSLEDVFVELVEGDNR